MNTLIQVNEEREKRYLEMTENNINKSTIIEQVIKANKVNTCAFRDKFEKLTISLSLIFMATFISFSLGVFHMTEVATNGDSFGEIAVPASLS